MQGAIAALSMTAPGLELRPGTFLCDPQVMELTLNSLGEDRVDLSRVGDVIQSSVNGFGAPWPQAFPAQPVTINITFHLNHWETWMQYLEHHHAQTTGPGNITDDVLPQSMVGELHLGICAVHHTRYTNRQASEPRGLGAQTVAVLALLLTLVVHTQEAAVARNFTTNLMVLAAAIITSGGNITNAKVWKTLLTTSCETMVDTLDITWEQILCGWDYLTGHWHNVQRSGTDFDRF